MHVMSMDKCSITKGKNVGPTVLVVSGTRTFNQLALCYAMH